MLDFLQKGGIVLWILVAISAYVISLIIERLLYFKRISIDEKKLYERIKAAVEKGHLDEALAICDQNLSPFASLMRAGIENRDYPRTIQKEMLEDAAAQEAPRLEKNIVAIGTIANIAPLIGLLGTVTGMISSFQEIETKKAPTPADLAKGVYESLVNTTMGLFAAIVFLTAYFVFKNKVSKMSLNANNTALLLLRDRSAAA